MIWQVEFNSSSDAIGKIEKQLSVIGVCNLSYFPGEGEADGYQINPGEAPTWETLKIRIYFDREEQLDRFLLSVQSGQLYGIKISTLHLSTIADKKWQTSWQKYWKPLRFGKLVVCSREDSVEANPDDTLIYLNPGLAFGTGTHESTALCLDWISTHELHGKKVLDYGSGSGILAIAAVARGSTDVVAYDHDPQAVIASWQNSELNGIQNCLTIASDDSKVDKKGKYDLIIANIILESLMGLADRFHSLLNSTGTVIVSGILEHQKTTLLSSWDNVFRVNSCLNKNAWLMICFQSVTNQVNEH